jgi:predicted phage terminase large subunit-like protein
MASAADTHLAALRPRMTPYIRHRPTPRQAAFLLVVGLEAFFGGAAGGGKSDALLMSALQYVDVSGYAAVLVRQSYAQLTQPGGLIARAEEWLGRTDATWNGSDHQWRFPSGASLTFRHLQDSGAERNFQGAEYHFIGVDEVTDISEEQYRFLFSRGRRLAGQRIPVRMRAASNPYGPGLEWCHRRFILEADGSERVFVPSRLDDNPHLDKDGYERSLRELGPIAYRQLRFGDWTVRPEGGLFRAEWFRDQMVERRQLPEKLRLCRFWDLASTEAGRGDPDYTAGLLLGRSSDDEWYVVDVVHRRCSPLQAERLILRTAEQDAAWAKDHGYERPAIRMEQEPGSAGVAVIDAYRRRVLTAFDFAGVRATGSKETRAAPVTARAEAGELWLVGGRWTTDFLDELCSFPLGSHDDQVDALSGAYAHLSARRVSPAVAPIGFWRESPWRI